MNANDVIRELHEGISDDLDRIAARFKGTPRITLIVRNPDIGGDSNIVLTSDNYEDVVAALDDARRAKVVVPNRPELKGWSDTGRGAESAEMPKVKGEELS